MKKALLLNIVDPGIGGVLIKGEKGTAKSTTVRSLSQILPEKTTVEGCLYNCNPDRPEMLCPFCEEKYSKEGTLSGQKSYMKVVELPLSATEDRVAGTLDIEHILKTGEKKFEPGVLAQANGNLLYVDEVNLLDDHIVDLLLDSAAMGINYVEREGISFSHPSRFVLVGTMNPEEGELRPQLLDRFGFSVDVKGNMDLSERMKVVKKRLEFDSDPVKYLESVKEESENLRKKLETARKILPEVSADENIVKAVVTITTNFEIDGHRADITMMKAAKANAALNGSKETSLDDVREVAPLVLSHRMRRRPFEEEAFDSEELEKCLQMI